jgi:rhodanese-related sulfurtransferase
MANHLTTAEAPRIGLEEAKKLFDGRAAVFVDVRPPEAYEEAHVPGAIGLPLREIPRRYVELPRDRQLVFY